MKKFILGFLILTGCHVVNAPPPAHPSIEDLSKKEDPKPPPSPVPPEAFEPENLHFQTVLKYAIEPRCLKCHGDEPNEDTEVYLKTYEGAIYNLEEIEEEVTKGSMPPKKARPLHPDQRALILKWIEANAPEKPPVVGP
jgi:uncharacterized membrane protein